MTGQAHTGIPLTAEALAQQLEADIVNRNRLPGERLPSERVLAASFGVSRPVVREVLRSLQERGLIVVHPGRGSFVRELEPTRGGASLEFMVRRGEVTVRDLVDARRMLESEAAALAATKHTAEDADRLRATLEAFEAASDVEVRAELDLAFHDAIAVASGNPVIMIMFGSIRDLTHAMVLRSLTDRSARRAGSPLHHVVLDAILARDPETARAAMTEHVTLAVKHYGADIDRPLAAVLRGRADVQPEVADLLRRASVALADRSRREAET